jgi:hypothetical protein
MEKDRYLARGKTLEDLITTVWSQKDSALKIFFATQLPDDKFDFIVTSQPQWWEKLEAEIDQRYNLVEKVEMHAGKSMVVVRTASDLAVAGTVDPNTGLPVGAGGGGYIDPRTGLPVAGVNVGAVDPRTGLPVAGDSVGSIDPSTGLPVGTRETCIANLRQIDSAKHMWAIEQHKKSGDIPTESDLLPYIGPAGHSFPHCPLQGTYAINAVGELPTCTVPGHTLLNESNANLAVGLSDNTNTSDASPSAETWAPAMASGEKIDLQKILSDATDLMNQGDYEGALQRHIWYHNHALQYDQGQTGVRLSFALSSWMELGRRYPKAKQALVEIRDRDASKLASGSGYADLFSDVSSINRELQDDDATYTLFKTIRDKDPQLAGECYFWAEDLLVAKGEYQWCYDHMGDPEMRFDQIQQMYKMQLGIQSRMASSRKQNSERTVAINPKNGLTNAPVLSSPDTSAMMTKAANDRFVGQVRQLIIILVATGHQADAEKIRDQALAVLDDDRLKSAIADAVAKVKK